jgi:hypothetical protein
VALSDEEDPYSSHYDDARRCARYGDGASEWDVGYGVYPRRRDLVLARRYDEIGPLETRQIYQYEMGIMGSGDRILCFGFMTHVYACNLSRPFLLEYLLGFNARNEFVLQSRWPPIRKFR